MAQSTFYADAFQFIDGVDQDFAPAWALDIGTAYLGGSKSLVRRGLLGFAVQGPAAEGRALTAGDELMSATLLLQTTSIIGAASWAARVERNVRADWDVHTADWNRYRTGGAWTSPGGDVGAPPDDVTFTSPAGLGAFEVPGLEAFVADAVALRSGRVLLRIKADDEAPPASAVASFAGLPDGALRPRLRVTYVAAEPGDISRDRAHNLRGGRAAEARAADAAAGAAMPARGAGAAPPARGG
ncbi:MAG TPA: hypothetical protein VNM91_08055 [Dehalococcoidia bacterium]|nr:hypothetical protein [Dehalococcoidia bacterium]